MRKALTFIFIFSFSAVSFAQQYKTGVLSPPEHFSRLQKNLDSSNSSPWKFWGLMSGLSVSKAISSLSSDGVVSFKNSGESDTARYATGTYTPLWLDTLGTTKIMGDSITLDVRLVESMNVDSLVMAPIFIDTRNQFISWYESTRYLKPGENNWMHLLWDTRITPSGIDSIFYRFKYTVFGLFISVYATSYPGGTNLSTTVEMKNLNLGDVTKVTKPGVNAVLNFQLEQNYPNPFNPSTTIEYSIPRAALAIIKVYDVLGREVKTLVSEEKLSGNYKVNFNASNLSSGMYIYRITAGNFVETKKMILLK